MADALEGDARQATLGCPLPEDVRHDAKERSRRNPIVRAEPVAF
jgi:hypothetical protein